MKKHKSFLEIFAEQLLKDSKNDEIPSLKYNFKSDLSHFIEAPNASKNGKNSVAAAYSSHASQHPFFHNHLHEGQQLTKSKAPFETSGTKDPASKKEPLEPQVNLKSLSPATQLKLNFLWNLGSGQPSKTYIRMSDIRGLHRELAKAYHPDRLSSTGPYEMAELNSLVEEIYQEMEEALKPLPSVNL